MTRIAKINTTDAQIDAALERAREYAADDRRAARATYDQQRDEISLLLTNGVTVLIPRTYLQGLQKAKPSQLSKIELLGGGTGLHWPKLDVSHYVPGLLNDVFGTRQWMAELGHLGGSSRSEAKKAASRVNGLKGGRPATKKPSSVLPKGYRRTNTRGKHGWSQIDKRKKTA